MAALARWFRHGTEGVAALMMAAMFCTFILQIFVRYATSAPWFTSIFGPVNTSMFGWTVEFILVLWLWTIFWGNSFVVRDRDHVTFDIIYNMIGRRARTVLTIIGALMIVTALWMSFGPTYDRMRLLKIRSSATLPTTMFPIYAIYFVFLGAVGLRYLWRAWDVLRHGADPEPLVLPDDAATPQKDRA